jgi:hypothetical protein
MQITHGAGGYAERVQIALILFRVELEKSLRETEDYLNEMPHVLGVFELDEAPHYSPFCRWEQKYRMRELRRLLHRRAEQAGWSGEAAIDASGFQRDQTSYHYRDRANYSFQSMKTTNIYLVGKIMLQRLTGKRFSCLSRSQKYHPRESSMLTTRCVHSGASFTY